MYFVNMDNVGWVVIQSGGHVQAKNYFQTSAVLDISH